MSIIPADVLSQLSVHIVIDGKENGKVHAKIFDVSSNVTVVYALLNSRISFNFNPQWAREANSRMNTTAKGVIYEIRLCEEEVNRIIKLVGDGNVERINIAPSWMFQLKDPCVRVPLSLIKQLRGMICVTDMSKRALESIWDYKEEENNG